jgi:hypothetical protein
VSPYCYLLFYILSSSDFNFPWNTFYQFHSDRYCKPKRSRTHFLRYLTVISLKLCKTWGWLEKWVETFRKKKLTSCDNCKIFCCAWLYFSPILWYVFRLKLEAIVRSTYIHQYIYVCIYVHTDRQTDRHNTKNPHTYSDWAGDCWNIKRPIPPAISVSHGTTRTAAETAAVSHRPYAVTPCSMHSTLTQPQISLTAYQQLADGDTRSVRPSLSRYILSNTPLSAMCHNESHRYLQIASVQLIEDNIVYSAAHTAPHRPSHRRITRSPSDGHRWHLTSQSDYLTVLAHQQLLITNKTEPGVTNTSYLSLSLSLSTCMCVI